MKRGSCFLALAAGLLSVAAVSCKGPASEKENPDPSVFKVTPNAANAEAALQHETKFVVTCDKEFKAQMRDGAWVSVDRTEQSDMQKKNNQTSVVVKFQDNPGEDARTDELQITSGSKTLTVAVKQLAFGNVLSETDVTLSGVTPFTVQVSATKTTWTAEVVDENGALEWLGVSPSSGLGAMVENINITAKSLNIGSQPRSARIKFTASTISRYINVTQPSDLPAGFLDQKVFGLYNYDGQGANLTYDRYAQQFSTLVNGQQRSFRLFDPVQAKFVEVADLPASYTPGARIPVVIVQNFTGALSSQLEIPVTVVKEEDGFVWLLTDAKVGLVIKKVE